jgi:predicted RNA binding protein YcfA (HicA-like mRNA interferase family)
MPRKLRELRAHLRRGGFHVQRQKGSHETWVHPLLAGVGVELVGKDGADAKHYQEREVWNALQSAQVAKLKGNQP